MENVTKRTYFNIEGRMLTKFENSSLKERKLKGFSYKPIQNKEKNNFWNSMMNETILTLAGGFNSKKWKGEVKDNLTNKPVDKNVKKYLLNTDFIVGDSEKTWWIKVPYNEFIFCISKKFIPQLKEMEIFDFKTLQQKEMSFVVEVFYHLNHRIYIRKFVKYQNQWRTETFGQNYFIYLLSTIQNLHLLAVYSLKLEIEEDLLIEHIDSTGKQVISFWKTQKDILSTLKTTEDMQRLLKANRAKRYGVEKAIEGEINNGSGLWDID